MSKINFMGSYSGIDGSMIDQIMEAEKMPLVQFANRKETITAQQNAWKDINTRMNSLFQRINVLKNANTYQAKRANSSNEATATMAIDHNRAQDASYSINVEKIATNSRFIGGKATVPEEGLASGSFTISTKKNGEDAKVLDIEVKEGDSLKNVVDRINEAERTASRDDKTGIRASLIDGRIVIEDTNTGARNISLEGKDSYNLSSLGLELGEDEAKFEEGQNATFTVNGIEVERSSNEIKDVIDGVTLNLRSEGFTHISVGLDTERLETAIKDFVDQYNSTMTFIEDKLSAGVPGVEGSKGDLAGDSTLMRLQSSLRQMVTSGLNVEGSEVKDISRLGVTTIDRFGKLQFDPSELRKQMGEDMEGVQKFLKDGFAPRVSDYIDSFVSTRNGIIKTKTESYDRTLKDINNQIETFNKRMERREEYYVKMFSALDVAMMRAESQMDWLHGQIDAMNGQRR